MLAVEPIGAIIEVAAKTVAKEAAKEAAKELPRELVKRGVEAGKPIELKPQYAKNYRKNLLESDFKHLNDSKENFLNGKTPEARAAALNEIINSPAGKGQLGEITNKSYFEEFADVKTQVNHKDSRIDLYGEIKYKDKKIPCITEDGSPRSKYLLKGDKTTVEVKNGDARYIMKNLGQIEKQVKAGKEISDHSFLTIREDVYHDLSKSELERLVAVVENAGGNVILHPGLDTQINVLLSA